MASRFRDPGIGGWAGAGAAPRIEAGAHDRAPLREQENGLSPIHGAPLIARRLQRRALRFVLQVLGRALGLLLNQPLHRFFARGEGVQLAPGEGVNRPYDHVHNPADAHHRAGANVGRIAG